MKKIILTFLSIGCLVINLTAQDNNMEETLNQYLDVLVENNKFMGSVTISMEDKIIYNRAVGMMSEGQEANEETIYRIGSISKTFTAVMIFQLIEQGELGLEIPLEKFYPEVPNAPKITIGHLLQHRSGLHNFTNDAEYLEYMNEKQSQEEMLELFASQEPDFDPGEKAEYSNTNYVLLGYILEKIYKKPYAEILQEQICSRLELSHTRYGGKINTDNNEALPFEMKGEDWEVMDQTDMSIPGGAGAVVSTTADLVRFMNALKNGEIISEKSLAMMREIQDGYGMGLFTFPFYDKLAYGHNGGIDAFQSNLAHFEDENITVAIMGNGFSHPFNNIIIGVLSIIFDKDFEIPTFETVDIPVEILEQYKGLYKAEGFPLDIQILVEDGQLFGQATGQSAFPLSATSETNFSFDQADITIEFVKSETVDGTFDFKFSQGGMNLFFQKEK